MRPRSPPSPACAIRPRPKSISPNRASPRWNSARPSPAVLVFSLNYAQGWDQRQTLQSRRQRIFRHGPRRDSRPRHPGDGRKVEEIDRGRIAVGNDVLVRVDSLPELTIPGRIRQISLLAETKLRIPAHSQLPGLRLDRPPRLAPAPRHERRHGYRHQADSECHQHSFEGAVHAGWQARRISSLQGGRYRPTEVQVTARNPDEVAISGIPAGAMVALVDAEKKDQKK